MASDTFLSAQQEQQIISAIKSAEKKTSGEIRIHIEHQCKTEPLDRADLLFHQLGMDQTEQQNGVLIYIATDDKKAAVYAGKGIHKRAEDGFWNEILRILISHFKDEAFAKGIEEAIKKVGIKLVEIFPYQSGDINELSDEISYQNSDPSQ